MKNNFKRILAGILAIASLAAMSATISFADDEITVGSVETDNTPNVGETGIVAEPSTDLITEKTDTFPTDDDIIDTSLLNADNIFCGVTISLEGKLVVNHYCMLAAKDLEICYVPIDSEGNIDTSSPINAEYEEVDSSINGAEGYDIPDGNLFKVSIAIPVKYYNSNFVMYSKAEKQPLYWYNDDKEQKLATISVEEIMETYYYMNGLHENPEMAKVFKKLVEATDNYGSLTADYFANKDEMEKNLSDAEKMDIHINALMASTATENARESYNIIKLKQANVEYMGSSVVLDSDTAIRFYFKSMTSGVTADALCEKIASFNENANVFVKGDMVCVEYANIPSTELSESKAVKWNNVEIVSSSVLGYVRKALLQDESYALKKVAIALLDYSLASDNFVAAFEPVVEMIPDYM